MTWPPVPGGQEGCGLDPFLKRFCLTGTGRKLRCEIRDAGLFFTARASGSHTLGGCFTMSPVVCYTGILYLTSPERPEHLKRRECGRQLEA